MVDWDSIVPLTLDPAVDAINPAVDVDEAAVACIPAVDAIVPAVDAIVPVAARGRSKQAAPSRATGKETRDVTST